MVKKFSIILVIFLLFIGLSGSVFAVDKYTTTSTINGVTVNWEYQINDSNEIESLICTNVASLTGDITVPSTLDGKTVVSLGNESFKDAVNITGVTIPSTVREIRYSSFENCSNLERVNLGQIESISFDVFKDCPKLTTITLPKTLKGGPSARGVFTGTTCLTSVTFEEGTTIIPTMILKDCEGITEITIPNTVKEIRYSAFENCSNLERINLGQIETISFDVFQDCPKLTSITLPKTLENGPGDVDRGVFTGTTNLTSVIFEEGTTTIVDGILKDCKGITEVTIPDTVTKVGERAFENTGIIEISFSNSLQEIGYYAFNDCSDLTKITILDNCEQIGFFRLYPTQDTVFQNHNEDLTIYCYENSKIAEYAIATNIKYEYIPRPETDNNTNEDDEENETNNQPNDYETPSREENNDEAPTFGSNNGQKEDPTTANGSLPKAGSTIAVLCVILIILVVGIISYIKYRKLKDI